MPCFFWQPLPWKVWALISINILHYIIPASKQFGVWQFVSYMFMHGGFTHILFNMFALWMFGNVLENVWGPKRFLNYYLVTGIGAGITHLVIAYIRIAYSGYELSSDQFELVFNEGFNVLQSGRNYSDAAMGFYNIDDECTDGRCFWCCFWYSTGIWDDVS